MAAGARTEFVLPGCATDSLRLCAYVGWRSAAAGTPRRLAAHAARRIHLHHRASGHHGGDLAGIILSARGRTFCFNGARYPNSEPLRRSDIEWAGSARACLRTTLRCRLPNVAAPIAEAATVSRGVEIHPPASSPDPRRDALHHWYVDLLAPDTRPCGEEHRRELAQRGGAAHRILECARLAGAGAFVRSLAKHFRSLGHHGRGVADARAPGHVP